MSLKLPLKLNPDENKIKFGIFRLDIRNSPGWFLVKEYDNEKDAEIYCEILNEDTNMCHYVFFYEKDET
jgi:hypothetical protein